MLRITSGPFQATKVERIRAPPIIHPAGPVNAAKERAPAWEAPYRVRRELNLYTCKFC